MGQEHKEYTWNLIAKKLTGDASPEELLELEALLRGNPELHYPLQTMADIWQSSSPEDQKLAERAFSKHLDRMQELHIDFQALNESGIGGNESAPDSRSNRRTKLIALSSILLLFIVSATVLFKRSGQKDLQTALVRPTLQAGKEFFTQNGSRTRLVLPDSTLVWLNAGSRITYDKHFGATFREVSLTGEAFFDVAHNPEKPFVIHAARVDIRVLGTRFNVKSYPSDKTTEATLIRGSIEVSIKDRPSEKIILKPNEKLVVANDDSTLHRKEPHHPAATDNESLVSIRKPTYESHTGDIIETSWVNNKLIFQDEPFKELASQMERWYGLTFHFTNPIQEEWRFTGNFQEETIQQALDALKLTQAFNYTIQENQITIYNR